MNMSIAEAILFNTNQEAIGTLKVVNDKFEIRDTAGQLISES